MATQITQGKVIMEIADELVPPAKAGKLTPAEVKAIPKARPGLGVACAAAAAGIEALPDDFTPPKGVTPATLRELGSRADAIDNVIKDAELLVDRLKQANLLFDAEALAALGKINDQVNAQGKKNKQIATAFSAVIAYYDRPSRKK